MDFVEQQRNGCLLDCSVNKILLGLPVCLLRSVHWRCGTLLQCCIATFCCNENIASILLHHLEMLQCPTNVIEIRPGLMQQACSFLFSSAMIAKIVFGNLEADNKNHFCKLKQSEQCIAAVHVTEWRQWGVGHGQGLFVLVWAVFDAMCGAERSLIKFGPHCPSSAWWCRLFVAECQPCDGWCWRGLLATKTHLFICHNWLIVCHFGGPSLTHLFLPLLHLFRKKMLKQKNEFWKTCQTKTPGFVQLSAWPNEQIHHKCSCCFDLVALGAFVGPRDTCLLYTSPSPRD